ncbi:hypothetical protein [Saccharothrix sp. ALI-22-I]|uniref:hypothetical protein n=1 Tax=Saccharothrix sp. ALI-22-I TaxID=1933778 RepID=UPI001EE7490C|nr:hypothetical protein [Saccharothrix sp. ALI-22-I]
MHDVGGATAIGSREVNADCYGTVVDDATGIAGFAVADGIGSRLGAETAAAIATTTAMAAVPGARLLNPAITGLLAAREALLANDIPTRGEDTVMVVAVTRPRPERGSMTLDIAWVGDCRALLHLRTIEVLVDRDAVTSGAAADGEPWQYYDLGHGYCTYTFFEQCPHRMACARCDFYTPKASSKGELLEAKDNLQRMLANLPLTEDEQAAVDDGQAALDALLERLADVPAPDGTTPREIGIPATATLLPIIAVNQGKPV